MAALKDISSKSVGNALMRILSTAVLPKNLLSDNGKEFLGCCINMIKEEFHTLQKLMTREDEVSYDVDEEWVKVVDKYRKEVLDRAKVTASKGTPTPKKQKTKEHHPDQIERVLMIHQVGVGLEKVKEAKIKQANRVNDLHARNGSGMTKLPLEKDDICTISIPKTIKSAVKKLQVMVTDLVYNRDGVCYKVCSKHGI